MGKIFLKEGYKAKLGIKETQTAIKHIKDYFENALAKKLNLTRVSAPLFVYPETGLNDDLSGYERPVSFDLLEQGGRECQIVHSLAKWKRMALQRYGFEIGSGLYTDMNAIRRDEETDNIHSIYVDQWDWEKTISKTDRNKEYLVKTVKDIYSVIKDAERYINNMYDCFHEKLPNEIYFITAEDLLKKYPGKSPKEREKLITREYGAVFLMQIGDILSDGARHDGRAPDYDDWSLNGDILVYNTVLEDTFELSSMGIRVDENSLVRQLEKAKLTKRLALEYHKNLVNKRLPYSIGGGIGQSRLCMLYLETLHLGEVHSSVWTDDVVEICRLNGINLL